MEGSGDLMYYVEYRRKTYTVKNLKEAYKLGIKLDEATHEDYAIRIFRTKPTKDTRPYRVMYHIPYLKTYVCGDGKSTYRVRKDGSRGKKIEW